MSGFKEPDAERKSGVAVIKAEYVISDHKRTLLLDCITESDKEKLAAQDGDNNNKCNDNTDDASQPYKKQKLSKGEKKRLRGQNKARPMPFKHNQEMSLCRTLIDVAENEELPICNNYKCSFLHDVSAYLAAKPPDLNSTCYVYSTQGRCPRGASCRFGSQHLTPSGRNIINFSLYERHLKAKSTVNHLDKSIQFNLRKRCYDFSKSGSVIAKYDKYKGKISNGNSKNSVEQNENSKQQRTESGEDNTFCPVDGDTGLICEIEPENISESENCIDGGGAKSSHNSRQCGAITDEDVIQVRKEERKQVNWKGKLYLSPLTTVGNLPFRRICKEFGAEITCGEMAMATSLLQGLQQEWALVKRHTSEDLFGVQLCGNNPHVMTRCAQMLEETTHIDFIDINLGCPIEFVYQQGGGSGLLRREKALESVIRCMSNVIDLPLTLKTRTGVYTDKNILHTLIPKFQDWGVSLVTVHGRSREQRYTKKADWDYIEQCAQLGAPVPVFGNGDVLSYEDYEQALVNSPSVAGIMIGRGALIKPWIFTEVKEQRHWDISSSERLDILKKYVNYGLEHWGSDTKGVENTRRFLLEWLSFLHRYIPVGLLEYPPQKINQRPPYYHGRDELETLMASPSCADWLRIRKF
ncbi:tRNA-dihydrouridine(47) synthase [NAD(P)(+)]-like isoform X2 [Cryptotermes secundus]|uniref:tRNA-dihydrouridine(47) synthase [NAD(P)(+)]-like isoform X2 n=1 Tax=Cryptotermes secundus TaxID=105785 RepID=UPI000CD7D7B5|nr:tRNA-dihydrouridine(47) synthase [NAD(P)(+)]-like isoform X2 [Cryptotermes secundus]